MQRMTDDPKTTCESCDGTLERLISASAFQFKGGGWYSDLYASPKAETKSSGESKDSSASSDSSSSTTKSSSDSGSKPKESKASAKSSKKDSA